MSLSFSCQHFAVVTRPYQLGSPCFEPGVWGLGGSHGTCCVSIPLTLGGGKGCPLAGASLMHQEVQCQKGSCHSCPARPVGASWSRLFTGCGLCGLFTQCLGSGKPMYWTWVNMDSKMCGLNPQPPPQASQVPEARTAGQHSGAEAPPRCCQRQPRPRLPGLPGSWLPQASALVAGVTEALPLC